MNPVFLVQQTHFVYMKYENDWVLIFSIPTATIDQDFSNFKIKINL